MHDDVDHDVGELFRRLGLLRAELGERALERTRRRLLQSLGACALEEAEHRGRHLGRPTGPRVGDIPVTPFARRRPPHPLDDAPGEDPTP